MGIGYCQHLNFLTKTVLRRASVTDEYVDPEARKNCAARDGQPKPPDPCLDRRMPEIPLRGPKHPIHPICKKFTVIASELGTGGALSGGWHTVTGSGCGTREGLLPIASNDPINKGNCYGRLRVKEPRQMEHPGCLMEPVWARVQPPSNTEICLARQVRST